MLERAWPALSPFARPTSLSLSLSLGKMKQGKESDDETKKRGK